MFSASVVSGAGDFNGDGFDDLLLGARVAAPGGLVQAGEAYVVFGRDGGLSTTLALGMLDAAGLTLEGVRAGDFAGVSVRLAGDVDGDGYGDVLIGAERVDRDGFSADDNAGEAYLVYGGPGGIDPRLRLDALGDRGATFTGLGAGDYTGWNVGPAGDFNGDGIDDFLIDAHRATVGGRIETGGAYVLFGSTGRLTGDVDLAALDGTNGFRILGVAARDFTGKFLGGAGDVNGDGFDDVLLGGVYADPEGRSNAGEVYVVFGAADGFAPTLALADLDGTNGFRIPGLQAGENLGKAVGPAGDVNGDGVDDFIIAAYKAGFGAATLVGRAYVVFGRNGGFPATLDLAALDGSNGFEIRGLADGDRLGFSVGSAGDMDGDGLGDVFISAHTADSGGRLDSGEVHVIYGSRSPFEAQFDIGSFDGLNGFTVAGAAGQNFGRSTASAGDVDGDGYDDLFIGAPGTREAYVLYGAPVDREETSTLVVRAAGTGGPSSNPAFRVLVDGVQIGQAAIAEPQTRAERLGEGLRYEDYEFTFDVDGPVGRVEIVYFNDGVDPVSGELLNLFVDRIVLDGAIRESESSGFFTPVRNLPGRAGPREDLLWDGVLAFDLTPSETSTLVVRAAGTGGPSIGPTFRVLVDGVQIGQAAVADPQTRAERLAEGLSYQDYQFTFDTDGSIGRIEVVYFNDGADPVSGENLNLFVDRIVLDGAIRESEIDGFYTPVRNLPGRAGSREDLLWDGSLAFDLTSDAPI